MVELDAGKISKKYLTLMEAAVYCGMAYSTARKRWPGWERFGVKAYKLNSRPLFKVDELDAMVEAHRVN